MKRHFAISIVFLSMCAFCAAAFADAPSQLIPESDANAVGMTRAWFAQATVMRGQEEVTSATLQDGTLFITTERGRLQAFDAETGVTLWTVDCGEGYLLPPGVNSKIVAAISGTNLLVYDRFTGKKLSETLLYGDPSAGPVVSEREIYVPLFSQRVMSYPIVREKKEAEKLAVTLNSMNEAVADLGQAADYWTKKFGEYNKKLDAESFAIEDINKERPYSCASFGTPMVPPIMGTQSYELDVVGWTTDQGWLILGEMTRRGDEDPFKLLYKLQARPNFSHLNSSRVGNRALIPRDDVESSPFFVPEDKSMQNMRLPSERRKGGLFIIGSESGHVYAMNDVTGMLRWTYLTPGSVSERITAFDDHAYIPTSNGDLYAVALKTGDEVWKTQDVVKTVAASSSRLYVFDSRGRLVMVNRANGEREKVLAIGQTKFQVFNQETDRVYVVTADGLIQCLHETQLAEPIRHREPLAAISARITAEMEAGLPEAPEPKKAPVLAEEDEEDTATSETVDPDDDPFGGDEEEEVEETPAESNDEEEDPFGGDDFGGDF